MQRKARMNNHPENSNKGSLNSLKRHRRDLGNNLAMLSRLVALKNLLN